MWKVRASGALLFVCATSAGWSVRAADAGIQEIQVIARRLPPALSEVVFATTTIDRSALDQAGTDRLDNVLRDIPGFSLFRRQASFASHPTTQGVTLRGLGPSGAGRTLVLLDGVPQNDPFGGWIDWSRLPPAALENVEVTRGGGAGPWGNAALAGTIRLQSRVDQGFGIDGHLGGNSFGSADGRVGVHGDLGRAHVTVMAAGHTGDGPYLIREDQRGPVDRRTYNKGGLIRGGITVALDDATSLSIAGSHSSDSYINGITIAKSTSRVTDGSISLVHDAGADQVGWEFHLYGRKGNLPAVFSAVNAARTTVTPSLNQFDVPSTAFGANALVRVPLSREIVIDAGADARRVDGATNELFQYVAPAFTRVRKAGGSQFVTGAFTEVTWMPRPAITLTASGRVDYWRQMDGMRRETVIASGAVLRNDRYATRDGTEGNFRVGGRVDVTPELALKAAAYSGFRVPTVNELYRPFRVGNDITEANPALRPENLKGVEAGLTWRVADTLSASLTGFAVRIDHAVGNVTIQTTPGLNPATGAFVPAGGTLRQRQNIDRVKSEGVEIATTWTALPELEFTARYLYTNPRVSRNSAAPALVGLRLAQVARHQARIESAWRPREGTLLKAGVQAFGGQFDDDQNTRNLAGYVTADLHAEQEVSKNIVLFLNCENLFDRTIEAGRSADGLVTIGMPRVLSGGVRWRL